MGARPTAAPPLSPGPSPSRPLGERTRSVAAFFEVRPEGKYTIFVTAYYDIPLSITSVNAQGEIDDGGPDLYYLATASDDRMHQGKTVQVTIDDALTTASVKGSLRIVSCTDEDGKPVTGSRCPIGQRVEVTATWGTLRQWRTSDPRTLQVRTSVADGSAPPPPPLVRTATRPRTRLAVSSTTGCHRGAAAPGPYRE